MITQPNPQIEARPATRPIEREPHLRPAPLDKRTTGTRIPNIALVGLQLIIGYEWLLAGGDKLLLGSFPTQLHGLLLTSVSGGHFSWRPTRAMLGIRVPV